MHPYSRQPAASPDGFYHLARIQTIGRFVVYPALDWIIASIGKIPNKDSCQIGINC
jgi:hypothetical protein